MAEGFQEIIPHYDLDAPRANARVRRQKLEYKLSREATRAIQAAGDIEGKRVTVAVRMGLLSGVSMNRSAVFTTERNPKGLIKKAFLDGKRMRLHKIAGIEPETTLH